MWGFDHPWLGGLLGDAETAALLGPEAEVAAMVAFEAALAGAEAEAGVIPETSAATIAAALAGFSPDLAALRAGTAKDGVVVPTFVKQLRAAAGSEGARVHYGATSQDVIDTALILRVKRVMTLFEARLTGLLAALEALAGRFGDRPMMGRTRMQAAIPITVGDRVDSWRAPLARALARLKPMQEELLVVQFGGAAGTLDVLGGKGPEVRAGLARRLDLGDVAEWQSQRDRIAGLSAWLATLSGSLGKLGQDVALMAQAGDEIRLVGGGASSAMAHKQNPVAAETLVALARFVATQAGGMAQAMVHEQERSGAAWTLEWLLLPPMLVASGTALATAGRLVGSIDSLGADRPE